MDSGLLDIYIYIHPKIFHKPDSGYLHVYGKFLD